MTYCVPVYQFLHHAFLYCQDPDITETQSQSDTQGMAPDIDCLLDQVRPNQQDDLSRPPSSSSQASMYNQEEGLISEPDVDDDLSTLAG